MQTITLFLWFNNKAEQAAKLYVSVFKNSKIISVNRDGEKIFSVSFEIAGREFIAFNGGSHFKFTPAISLFVDCKTQQEVDYLWKKLSIGGKKGKCGWLTDKFGISWQIIPSILGNLMEKDDSGRVMQAMLKMGKVDVKKLKEASRK